jgi:hypothetical protein
MAAILDVWIARPGDPCYVDDHAWVVRVFDCKGVIYHWANNDYGQLPAPHAHWAGTIPPGCYVVRAEGKDAQGKAMQTDHAIVTVGCEGHVCVRLFVSTGRDKTPPPKVDLLRFTIAPREVRSGSSWKGTVLISGPAPSGGVDINLSSSDPVVADVPPSVHVPDGNTTASFTAPPTQNQTRQPIEVTITASLGATHKTAKLIVLPISH